MDTIDPNDHPKPLDAAALNADLEAIENDADVGVEFHAAEDGICPDCGKPASEHPAPDLASVIAPEWDVSDEEAQAQMNALADQIDELIASKYPGIMFAWTASFGKMAGHHIRIPEFMKKLEEKPPEERGKLALTTLHGAAGVAHQASRIIESIRELLEDAVTQAAAKAALAQFLREQAAASAKNEQKPELN